MADDTTTIEVKGRTWTRLNRRKCHGDSFDDVVTELLDQVEELEQGVGRLQQQEQEQHHDESNSE